MGHISLFSIGEYDSIILLKTQIDEISNLCIQDLKKLKYLINQVGYDFDAALKNIDDCSFYENMNLNDLAYDFIEEGLFGTIPDNIKNYLDYDSIARDLSFDYTEYDGDIFRAS